MHPRILLLACACLMSTWAAPADAGAAQTSFAIRITLQTGKTPSNSGICRSGSMIGPFGSEVTVVCSTGALTDYSGDISSLPWATLRNSSYRYVTQLSRGHESLGTIDSYTSGGAITSLRIIRLAHLDYLEMMVLW